MGSHASERPKLYPSPSDYEKVAPYTTQKFITLSPQSVWFTKQYPQKKWVDFIQAAPQDMTIYLLGGPGDFEKNEEIKTAAGHPKLVNLAGELSFLQSAALMQSAHMNFVNDSGPLHLCSAMNAKVTAIFCSTTPQFGFTPLSDDSVVIESATTPNCKPCGLHGHKACPKQHFNCANQIATSQLLARI
jgi:heptosyltransferase-2